MQAYVYKSQRKQDSFVYLAVRDDFSVIPDAVKASLAPFQFVLEVALTPDRRLAQADAAQVRQNLTERGFQVVALSGEHSQSERNNALQSLRDKRARVCVATASQLSLGRVGSSESAQSASMWILPSSGRPSGICCKAPPR